MKDDAFIRSLRAFCRRKPFRNFVLQFQTGERLTIAHPEVVFVAGEVVYYLNPEGRYRLFDASSVNQLMDIDE